MPKKIPLDMLPGTIHASKNSGNFEVKSYVNSRNVVVRFVDTNYETTSNVGNIREKSLKDPLFRSILGVGFTGIGKHKAVRSRVYDAWRCMLIRCYSPEFHEKEPSYKDCSVCDEWKNFQNFADWFYDHHPTDGFAYAIDKDLKIIGNKIYSPNACMFVTQDVNAITTDMGRLRGEMMIGVDFIPKRGVFRARCSQGSISTHLGYFNSEASAHAAWREAKSNYIIELSSKQDNPEVSKGLVNYARAIDDRKIYRDGYTK